MANLFTDHPATVDESYSEHLVAAGGFGLQMIIGGIACLLHAVFPFMFEKTGSKIIITLHERMVTKRNRKIHAQHSVNSAAR